jgi:hypothetical protein
MEKKYHGKGVMLPQTTAELLAKMRAELTTRLGFEPSASETIAVAINHWIREEM